jgi:UDP-glucose 4-epimerase
MAILVTGGTGLVGSRLLRRLVDAGVDCRALVRPGKEVPAGASPVEGDLFDTNSLKRAVEGVSAIVHLAAVFGLRMKMTFGGLIWMAQRT